MLFKSFNLFFIITFSAIKFRVVSITALTNFVNKRSHFSSDEHFSNDISYQHHLVPFHFENNEKDGSHFTVTPKCTPYFTQNELVLSNTISIWERLNLNDIYKTGKQLILNSALLHVDGYHSSYQGTAPKIQIELPYCRANNYPNLLSTYVKSLGSITGLSYINFITQEAAVQLNSGLPTTQLVEAYKRMEEYVQSVHQSVSSTYSMPFQLHLHNSLICAQINVKSDGDKSQGTSYIMLFQGLVGQVDPNFDETAWNEKRRFHKNVKPHLLSVKPLLNEEGTFSNVFSKDNNNVASVFHNLVEKISTHFDHSSFVCSEKEFLNQPLTKNHCIAFDPISQHSSQENISEYTLWAQCSALVPINTIAVYDKECEKESNGTAPHCVTETLYRICTASGWSESRKVNPNDTKLMQSFGLCKKSSFP